MDIDWKQVKEFTVTVGNRTHRAVLQEIGPEGELYLQIVERDHPFQKAATGGPGRISFVSGGQSYCFHGKVCAHGQGRIMVIREAGIIVNHRQELRLAVPPFPAEIRAKAFLRTKVLEAFIYDISRKGVRVATEVGLETEKQCRLATSLMVKKSYRPFEALCSVRYCLPERNRYFSGLRFDQVGLEARKVLEKFLTEVRAETSLF